MGTDFDAGSQIEGKIKIKKWKRGGDIMNFSISIVELVFRGRSMVWGLLIRTLQFLQG